MITRLVFAVVFFLVSNSVSANDHFCRELADAEERLACYDELFEKPTENSKDEENEINSATVIPADETALADRQQEEKQLFETSYGIFPYRRSYLLPFTYVDNINEEPYQGVFDSESDESLNNYEMKFQISFKVPIGRRFLFGNDQLYFGYTQMSLWQAYSSELSSPFRENNYQPELLWHINLSEPLFHGRLSHIVLGLNHQSNGQSGELSRSWNRMTFDTTWADEDWVVGLRLWYRFKESEEDDDNPDIEKYLGYGNLEVGYRWKDYRFTGTFLNNLRRDENHTSVSFSVSRPISRKLRGFIQYYNGYGETLIDYNHRTRRLGLGVVLSDWF